MWLMSWRDVLHLNVILRLIACGGKGVVNCHLSWGVCQRIERRFFQGDILSE